ncbi:hypothetical protein FLAG1_09948 [Fusarium langsethiae]|uniref:Uncharacterized protein n=1 Tax=Fusarium langsethiae TaxID=179993 RepID=A0A0M9EQ06_FUSLA|nr:hypothetical protein FLAG1_09948 [Fusarium langsethiae]GKU07564.1 unnamed protein product [Fusarium langsethiae]GKU22583.1 unnamed protein product [Fusarium langsethiae]
MSSTKELRMVIEQTTRHFLGAYKDCGEANDPSIINRDVTEDCKRQFLPAGVMALVGAPAVVILNNAEYEAAVAQDMTKSLVTATRISNLVIDTEACKAAATTVTDVKFHDGEVVVMEHSWVLDFNEDGSKVSNIVEFCDMDGALSEQFGNGFTVVRCDLPDIKDQLWSALGVDLKWQTLGKIIECDFRKYSKSSRRSAASEIQTGLIPGIRVLGKLAAKSIIDEISRSNVRGRASTTLQIEKDGKLHLYKSEEGFLYSEDPTGKWGVTLFIRNQIHLHVVVPFSYLVVDKKFRPLHNKQQDSMPADPIRIPDVSLQTGSTKLKRFVRAFWSMIRNDIATFRVLGVSYERYNEMFSSPNFATSIQKILNGMVPEAERIMRVGNFGLEDLLGRPDATKEVNVGQGIYLRIYLLNDGTVGLYVGQTHNMVQRTAGHDMEIKSETRSKHTSHYRIARKSAEDDRYSVVLCYWAQKSKSRRQFLIWLNKP